MRMTASLIVLSLASFGSGKPDLNRARALVGAIRNLLRQSPKLPVTRNWRAVRAWLRVLVAHREMVVAATAGGDVTAGRNRLTVLLQGLSGVTERVRRPSFRAALFAACCVFGRLAGANELLALSRSASTSRSFRVTFLVRR